MSERLKTIKRKQLTDFLSKVKNPINIFPIFSEPCLLKDMPICEKDEHENYKCGSCEAANGDQKTIIKIAIENEFIKISGPLQRYYAPERILGSKLGFNMGKELVICHSEGEVKAKSY